MARAVDKKPIRVDGEQLTPIAGRSDSNCARCGGLMVKDVCMELLNGTGEAEFSAKRCVQCGEVVDPVILRNRWLRQESIAIQSLRISVQSIEHQVQS